MLPALLAAYRKYGSEAQRWSVATNHRWISGLADDRTKNGTPTLVARWRRSQPFGDAPSAGPAAPPSPIGRVASAAAITTTWTIICVRCFSIFASRCAYAYPASKVNWKNTMHVFQTAGLPPSIGNSCFAIIGCTRNSRLAPEKIAITNRNSIDYIEWELTDPNR